MEHQSSTTNPGTEGKKLYAYDIITDQGVDNSHEVVDVLAAGTQDTHERIPNAATSRCKPSRIKCATVILSTLLLLVLYLCVWSFWIYNEVQRKMVALEGSLHPLAIYVENVTETFPAEQMGRLLHQAYNISRPLADPRTQSQIKNLFDTVQAFLRSFRG